MPYVVYILRSNKDKKLYVGCTNDLTKRLERHNKGYVRATTSRRPLTLIHQETFDDKSEAFNRERFLKSLWGAREKQKIVNTYIQRRASH